MSNRCEKGARYRCHAPTSCRLALSLRHHAAGAGWGAGTGAVDAWAAKVVVAAAAAAVTVAHGGVAVSAPRTSAIDAERSAVVMTGARAMV